MATNHEAGSSNLSECKSSAGWGYAISRPPWRWALPLALALADGAWGLQALATRPPTADSRVALASLGVWFFLHLPAAVVGGAVLRLLGRFNGGLDGLAPLTRWTLAALGALQVLALARLLVAWLARRRP